MKLFWFFVLLICMCCNPFSSGFYNANNQYVPKKPKFQLKDKPGLILPEFLDLENLYQLDQKIYRGTVIYPIDSNQENANFEPLLNTAVYMKFLPDGRCYSFTVPQFDDIGNPIILSKSDIYANNPHVSKQYYFSSDGRVVEIESFVKAEGQGKYIVKKAEFLNTSSQLKISYYDSDKTSFDLYSIVKIPSHWNDQDLDW